jgi:hypothetical protein
VDATIKAMNTRRIHGTVYEIVVRGEMGDQFGVLYPGVTLTRLDGTTVLTCRVADQAQLLGIIDRTQDMGLELVSLRPVNDGRMELG